MWLDWKQDFTQVDHVYLVTVIVTDVKRQITCLTMFPTPKHCGTGTIWKHW